MKVLHNTVDVSPVRDIVFVYFVDFTLAVLWAEMYLPPQLNKQHITEYPVLIDTSVFAVSSLSLSLSVCVCVCVVYRLMSFIRGISNTDRLSR